MVPSVWTLKKNASANDPGRAFAIPPVRRKARAKSTSIARTIPAMASNVSDQGARKSW